MKYLCSEGLEEEAEGEQGCDSWLVESDSDSSPDESDWINVESDGSNNFEISDSDSEMVDGEHSFARSDQHEQSSMRVSSFATTRVRNTPSISCETQTNIPLDTYSGRFCFDKRPQNQSCRCGR